jgi:hypothetical protein
MDSDEDIKKLRELYWEAVGKLNAENFPKKPVGLSGWVCPVCGAGLSPFTAVCPCKPMPIPKITC